MTYKRFKFPFSRKLEIQFMDEDVPLIRDYHPIIHVNRQHEIETESRFLLKSYVEI